jgi:hypothetical protein
MQVNLTPEDDQCSARLAMNGTDDNVAVVLTAGAMRFDSSKWMLGRVM